MTEPNSINPKRSLVHSFKTQQFGGVIIEEKTTGQKKLKLNAEAFYRTAVNKFKNGDQVTLYLTNKRPKRTEQQNRYYWGVYLPLIAQETGESDIDALHQLFKGKFLGKTMPVLGYPTRIEKSTTELSVIEFGEYIMAIENLTGIAAPPTENHNLAPLKHGK